jgi:hypothetical protein
MSGNTMAPAADDGVRKPERYVWNVTADAADEELHEMAIRVVAVLDAQKAWHDREREAGQL